jgi:anaphase-promoting complex subunit 4
MSLREDIFSSRASLDALFRPFDPKDNDSVDVMVVGTSDGHIHLSIYDSFVVGSFPSPLRASKSSSHQLVLHASHKNYSVHGLLMKSTSTLVGGLYFVPMDLRFITSSGHLSLLASRSTALQNLLRYIRQVQTLMAAEFHASQDLPSKFLRNINETLAEHGGWTIVPALYHQVVTGHTLPEVKEWLVDELAERVLLPYPPTSFPVHQL